jgi:hypothetical protein
MFLNQVLFQNAIVLELNETYFVNIYTPGLKVFFKFTPPNTRTYDFRSYGTSDTYVTLYGENGNRVDQDDDNGGNRNFYLSRGLIKNTTYYFEIKLYSLFYTGSFNVILS